MTKMKYEVTPADRRPLPARYNTEARYLGYRAQDKEKPYASFFRESSLPIQDQAREALVNGPVAQVYGVRLREVADMMSRPGYHPLESGYTRNIDGHIVVAVLTKMPNVTGEMWDWWFGWHGSETARYKLWHPDAHIFSAMAEDRGHNRSLTDRQRYVNNCSYVDEYLGEKFSPLTVRFMDAEKAGFAPSRAGLTTIVARGGLSTSPLAFAWLVHQVRATEDGCEMRSRFIVNDLALLAVPSVALPPGKGRILANPVVRALANQVVPHVEAQKIDSFGPRMLHHCAQEMNHLASFLPKLYEAFAGTP
jgi:hypothetical protein